MAFEKGRSGNPGGRPKIAANVMELARKHTEAAMNTLAQAMEDVEAPWATRVAASSALLDRGWGKPFQAVAVANSNEGVAFILQNGPAPIEGTYSVASPLQITGESDGS